ncbi:ABC transporter permease, partial [Rhizobium ruizarguesonis]
MTEFLKRLLKTPQGAIGLFLVALVLLIVVFGPLVAPHDPEAISPLARYKSPSAAYWLGTDQYGRDIFC